MVTASVRFQSVADRARARSATHWNRTDAVTTLPKCHWPSYPYEMGDPVNPLGFENYNVMAAGIAVGILCLPVITSLTEDSLRAVPRALREAAYALGATRFDDIIVTGGYRSASRIEIHSGRAVTGTAGLLATRQAFAAFGTANLPVFAAAIPPSVSGQFASLAVVQNSPNGLGIRRLSANGATETLLVNLAGPLRVAASRG